MRVQVLSDLHFEFDHDGGEKFAREVPIAGDVLVLAGDLLPLREADKAKLTFAWFCDRFSKVIFVPGNHEYYGTSPTAADAVTRTRWSSSAMPSGTSGSTSEA